MSKGKHKHKARMACSNARRFKGTREPRCNSGYGCYACWRKFILFMDERVC